MDEDWFTNLKWSGECLLCKANNDGQCPNIKCAMINYDQNGNKIPLKAWHADGNTLNKYPTKGK